MDLLQRSFEECEPWMYPLLFASTFLVAIVIERTVSLHFQYTIRATVFLDAVEKLLSAGNPDRALKLARAAGPQNPLGQVVEAGLKHADDGPDRARLAMDEATVRVLPGLRKRLNALLVIGGASLVVGLFGSDQLGGLGAAAPGAATPLPFGQPMHMAPALAGGLLAVVAGLAYVAFRLKSKSLEQELGMARLRIIGLVTDRGRRRPHGDFAHDVDGSAALPRLGNLGGPPGPGDGGDASNGQPGEETR